MKKLGLFGGSFKPFTTGHFAKLALALEENDEVMLFYTISIRDKAGVVITREMSYDIYEIMSNSLLSKYGDKLKIKISNPTPVVNIFQEIEKVKNNKSDFTNINVYGSEDIYETYIGSIIGKQTRKHEDKEEKYYGNLYSSGVLKFNILSDSANDIKRLTEILKNSGHVGDLKEKTLIRGTQIRQFVQNKDIDGIINYLPALLTSEEKNQIVEILFSNIKPTLAGLLPHVG